MNILLLSRYGPLGASSRIRSYQYLPYLKSQGIDVTVAPLLNDGYVKALYSGKAKPLFSIFGSYMRRLGNILKSRSFDLVWVEYELFPWLPAWMEIIMSYIDIPYIVDYDDAIFHRYNMHSRAMVRVLLGTKIDAVMRHAELVIVGNEYLGDYARKAGAKRVECTPSVIDPDRYNSIPPPENLVFTIGWIGSPATVKYLQLIRASLAEVCKNGSARLVLVGSGQFKLDGVPTEIHAWSEETEVTEIQSFDVGIMPMPDSAWAQGKCGYKLIQYMACARPVVASPVGVAPIMINDNINGFLANATKDWVKALCALRENYSLRERMGKAGRMKVERQYSIQVTAPLLVSLLMSIG